MKTPQGIAGTWASVDEFSSVEFRIRKHKKSYKVTAIDRTDDEVPAVSEENYIAKTDTFSFALYWTSTGRFTRYRLHQLAPDQVEFTYTHTDTDILVRKKTPQIKK